MTTQPTAVIHDIGYRHYDGERLGRGRLTLALTTQSLRGAFGLGRTARAKIMPMLLVGTMFMPVAVLIGIAAIAKQDLFRYPSYVLQMQAVIAVFLAAQAPYLVAPDLRHRVLPLYLSRPLTVFDYIVAKVSALTVALFLLMAVPLTVLFIGELLVDLPGAPHTGDFFASLGGAAIGAVLLACIGIALASFTPRRGLGVASVIAFYMFTAALSSLFAGLLDVNGYLEGVKWAWMINPFFLIDAVQSALFGTPPSPGGGYPSGVWPCLIVVALIAVAVSGIVLRYRKAASS